MNACTQRVLFGLLLILGLSLGAQSRAEMGIEANGLFSVTIPFGGDGKGPEPLRFGLYLGPNLSQDGGISSLGATNSKDPFEGFLLQFDQLGAGRIALGWFSYNWAPEQNLPPALPAAGADSGAAGFLQERILAPENAAPGSGAWNRAADDGGAFGFSAEDAARARPSVPLSGGFLLGDMFEGLTITIPLHGLAPETNSLGAEMARSQRRSRW